jgi:uncharacterized membrane protein
MFTVLEATQARAILPLGSGLAAAQGRCRPHGKSKMKLLSVFGTTLAVFLVVDMIWLMGLAKSFYRTQLGSLMTEKVNMGAAGAFYLLYAFGLMMFVILPHLARGDWMGAGLWGGLFGLVAYGTYDLTNLATLRGWPMLLSIVDLVWGGVLSALTAAITVRLLA